MAATTQVPLSYGQCYGYALGGGFTPAESVVMAAIALAESSGRPWIVNSIGCVGLWQINPVNDSLLKAAGVNVDNLTDPHTNAVAAHVIWQHQGLNAWQTYSDGTYRQFLAGTPKNAMPLGGTGMSAPPSYAKARQAGYTGTPAQYKAEGASWWSTLGGLALKASPLGVTVNALSSPVSSIEAVGHLANELTSRAFWQRVGLFVAGVAVLLLGLYLWDRRTIDAAVATAGKVAAAGA